MTPSDPHHFAGFARVQQRCWRNALLLILVNAALQLMLWSGLLPGAVEVAGVPVFAVLELGLMVLLLLNGGLIWRWCRQTDPGLPLRSVATLCLAALLLCFCGDIVNKNFADLYYQYDNVIEHSYLIDSIVFFFPGYALMLLALWVAVRDHLSQAFINRTLIAGVIVGWLAAYSLDQPQMNAQAQVMMTVYAVLICCVGISAWWLLKVFGKQRILAVASGALLATVADAMIGHLWIADTSHYPDVRYLNWTIYFSSQALLQQLPLRLAQVEIEAEQALQR